MKELKVIYRNDFGVAFQWKNQKEKIQIIFREMGFYLNLLELKSFREKVLESLSEQCCKKCEPSRKCRSLLLPTPSEKIDLAVNRDELEKINDLLGATIFQCEIQEYLKNFSMN